MGVVTDPIADALTRIRNAARAGQRRVDLPISKLAVEVVKKLADAHFVQDYKVIDDGRFGRLRVYLRYTPEGRPVIRELRRVSSPGRRRYVKVYGIPKVRGGLGMAILSTSRGVLSDREARAARVGGELMAIVY
ncbi:MAG: 30S ribosomal protein S8 [Gemmatimonadetes bacterium]|nr:30S ribosomal protein S8 [Gemmatimonadota bacterium]